MLRNNFFKYYRVFWNDTAVTEISVNDFKPIPKFQFSRKGMPVGFPVDILISIPYVQYTLPANDSMFYGYLSKAKAMEKAKAGALLYISKMIKDVELAITKLKTYRANHYEDLNTNLLDANIRRMEKEMNIK